MTQYTQLYDIFQQNHGIASSQYLTKKGISHYEINKLLANETLIKLKRGIYKWATTETNEMVEVARMLPKGIFCLQTACFYYDLTTSIPSAFHIAIPDMRHVVLPDYPPIQLYYWNKIAYELGVCTIIVDNQPVQMYDLEKTICDTIRHRHKIGFDVLKEILKNYLQKENRSLNRLNLYAKQLNIQNKVNDFIKILV